MGNVQQQVGKRMTIGRHEVEAVQYLGEGGSSFIFLVKDVRAPPTASPLVLKRLVAHNEQTAEWIASEIKLHQRLCHPQVVQFVASHTSKARGDKSEVFILMAYCPGGHLQENMLKMGTKRFAQHELLRTFKSLCVPVSMLHAQKPPIAHRDLKLENFLLGKEGIYQLCDFGSCVEGPQSLGTKADRMRESENVSKRTTAMYRSPELADVEGTAMFGAGELTEAVDVWAMGCILYSMAFFKSPFPLEGLRTDRYTIPANSSYSPEVHTIIARMLTADVEKRATIDHIMECIDEVLRGRPLPPLSKKENDDKKKKKKKGEETSVASSFSSSLSVKKTEARKETVTTLDSGDLLNMTFNPIISDNKPPATKPATASNAFDTTWTAPAESFANFATFPSSTSNEASQVVSSTSVMMDPFDQPFNQVKQQATPTSTPSMASNAVAVDPFAEIDAPPPALLYGGQRLMGQQHMGQGQQQMGQHMGQGQQQMGQHMGQGQQQMGQPYMGQPQMGQPFMGQQQMGQPFMGQQHIGQPFMGQQQMGQPYMGQQQMGQPYMGQQTGYHSSNPF